MCVPPYPNPLTSLTMDSLEYKTILECKPQLITALKADPQSVITDLEANGLIPHECISASKSNVVQAREAVTSIIGRVENSPSEYQKILDILSKYQWLKTGIKILREKYGKNITSNFNSLICQGGVF